MTKTMAAIAVRRTNSRTARARHGTISSERIDRPFHIAAEISQLARGTYSSEY
jgi:hypothetical protein